VWGAGEEIGSQAGNVKVLFLLFFFLRQILGGSCEKGIGGMKGKEVDI